MAQGKSMKKYEVAHGVVKVYIEDGENGRMRLASDEPRPIKFKIDDNGCWNCVQPKARPHQRGGYPQFWYQGHRWELHRLVYLRICGYVEVVRHSCDNPACINPEHLLGGTYQNNTDDMVTRNRVARGETGGQSKLREEDVYAIRASAEAGVVLARRYGVSDATISRVRHRVCWKHLPEQQTIAA